MGWARATQRSRAVARSPNTHAGHLWKPWTARLTAVPSATSPPCALLQRPAGPLFQPHRGRSRREHGRRAARGKRAGRASDRPVKTPAPNSERRKVP